MDNVFHLKIVSREGVVFDGKVVSVSSYNQRGKFDILSLHTNFISLIYKKIEIVKPEGSKQVINIQKALLKNKANNLEIFVGIDNLTNVEVT